MPLRVKGVVDGGVGGQETMRRSLGFEPLHPPLAPSEGQVAALGPVVLPQAAGLMQALEAQVRERCGIGSEPVGDDPLRLDRLIAEQPTDQLGRGLGVARPLHHKLQDLPFVVHARHRYMRRPPTWQTISSRCHRGDGAGRACFKRRAIWGPNLMVQQRIVS